MTELEEKLQDAEVEIAMAMGCLAWAQKMTKGEYNSHIYDHLNDRIDGLEKALNTLKELDAIVHKEQADVHEPEKD